MTETAATGTGTGPRWGIFALGVLCAAAGVAGSALFLPRQSLWNDEATQMSGLTLDPIALVRWLANLDEHEFGVAEDRMPPLSYWVGWAWSRVFGLTETSMRIMGVTLKALATLLVFAAGRRTWGTASGAAAALLFGLAPNVVVASVEIRAYPLFMLTSAGLFYCTTRLLDEPAERQPRWLAGMTACAIAGIFTHFFGLVAAGGAFLAALVIAPRRGGRLAPILAACAVVALATGGVAPFVMASVNMTDSKPEFGTLRNVARFIYRLVFHASMRPSLAATLAAAAGFALAGLACLAPAGRGRDARNGLLIAGVSGILVVVAASRYASFNTLATHYSSWIQPVLALLLGSGLAAARPWARRASLVGVAAMLGAVLYGDYTLATRGDAFAHTGFALVDGAVRRFGPEHTVVVYDEVGNPWDVYAPLRARYGGRPPQFVLTGEEGGRIRLVDYPKKLMETDLASIPGEYLIVVRWLNRSSDEVVEQLNGGYREIGDGAASRFLKSSPDWTLVEEGVALAYVAEEIDVFRRKSTAPAPAASGADR
ncbi:glycosyltransferase family 39 protein [Paludisphaera mucosa]|uniref:Glycosyltransferase family 39 protein n=1 Tax=Paludisphaera mucosa TaxID=3030827 RepID=A0ABT6FHL9_9BACT|nr:glycosyltransferase family 39 protein [Paludisphaera mucosa]MDG3006986.1 glycosyltransferase family 39 protein [Paludisphaera mucosa]